MILNINIMWGFQKEIQIDEKHKNNKLIMLKQSLQMDTML